MICWIYHTHAHAHAHAHAHTHTHTHTHTQKKKEAQKNDDKGMFVKVNKNEEYRLSHKIAKNTFMALFLKTGLLQT